MKIKLTGPGLGDIKAFPNFISRQDKCDPVWFSAVCDDSVQTLTCKQVVFHFTVCLLLRVLYAFL